MHAEPLGGKLSQLFVITVSVFMACGLLACGPTPAKLEIVPAQVVLDGADAQMKLNVRVLDRAGKTIETDADIIWFSEDDHHFKLSQDGTLKALASGSGEVVAELVGHDIKAQVRVRVKIASSLEVSHKRLGMWVGYLTRKVWAKVRSEKGALIQDFRPTWHSLDPAVAKVETVDDFNSVASFAEVTALKSGDTRIVASFRHLKKEIVVRVLNDDEEIDPAGQRIKISPKPWQRTRP